MDWSNCTQTVTVDNNSLTPTPVSIAHVATLNCIPVLFQNLITVALAFVGTVAVIMIIWAGVRFIRSGGDAKQAQGARQTITWAIIGLIIILLSFAILNLISDFTGVSCIKLFGFSNCQ